jgi:methylase of polypeptide subunit release factors
MKHPYAPHLALAHTYWKKHLLPTDFAIDMTCGNGHDTLVLHQLLPEGEVFAFDIQPSALQNTEERLQAHRGGCKVRLFLHSHANWDEAHPLPQAPRLIVYNLGYLPGSDKTVTTQTASTLQSLAKAIAALSIDGALSITCYPGHLIGKQEEKAVLDWASELPSAKWEVCLHRWINRVDAPSLRWVGRKL